MKLLKTKMHTVTDLHMTYSGLVAPFSYGSITMNHFMWGDKIEEDERNFRPTIKGEMEGKIKFRNQIKN